MSEIWFTSDWHLGHHNIIGHCNRPFNNITDMDNKIILNYINMVKKGDTVFFLGDFAWKVWYYKNILPDLPGDITFVIGNHDEKFKNHIPKSFKATHLDVLKIYGYYITLCHYPMESWYNRSHQQWHLHGHTHSTSRKIEENKIDIGVDGNDFKPWNFSQIMKKLRNK